MPYVKRTVFHDDLHTDTVLTSLVLLLPYTSLIKMYENPFSLFIFALKSESFAYLEFMPQSRFRICQIFFLRSYQKGKNATYSFLPIGQCMKSPPPSGSGFLLRFEIVSGFILILNPFLYGRFYRRNFQGRVEALKNQNLNFKFFPKLYFYLI